MNTKLTYPKKNGIETGFKVVLHGLPAVQPQIIKTTGLDFLCKIKAMAMPRKYKLTQHWRIEIFNFENEEGEKVDYDICIPEGTEIDGASIPAPWLIALLSLGVLRPMGILLTASIVHDYAFQHGALPYTHPRKNYFKRHNADKLFKDMTTTVNEAPIAAFFAWWGVRLGVLGYKKPIVDYVSKWNEQKNGATAYQLKKRAVLDRGQFPIQLMILSTAVVLLVLKLITLLIC